MSVLGFTDRGTAPRLTGTPDRRCDPRRPGPRGARRGAGRPAAMGRRSGTAGVLTLRSAAPHPRFTAATVQSFGLRDLRCPRGTRRHRACGVPAPVRAAACLRGRCP